MHVKKVTALHRNSLCSKINSVQFFTSMFKLLLGMCFLYISVDFPGCKILREISGFSLEIDPLKIAVPVNPVLAFHSYFCFSRKAGNFAPWSRKWQSHMYLPNTQEFHWLLFSGLDTGGGTAYSGSGISPSNTFMWVSKGIHIITEDIDQQYQN